MRRSGSRHRGKVGSGGRIRSVPGRSRSDRRRVSRSLRSASEGSLGRFSLCPLSRSRLNVKYRSSTLILLTTAKLYTRVLWITIISWLLRSRNPTMPSCSVGDSLFAELHYRQTKEDLEGVFGDDYEMLDTMDLNTIDIDDVDLSFFETNCDEDSDEDLLDPANWVRGNHDCMLGGQCCNQDSQRAQVPPPRPAPQPVVQPAPQSSASAPSVLITHSANKVVTIQKCIPAGSDRSDVVVVTNNSRTPPVSSGSRSLLLNRTTVQTQQQTSPAPAQTLLTAQPSSARVIVKREFPTPQPSRPETPMSLSESEDDFGPIPIDAPVDNSTSIFRSALDVLTTPTPGVWDCDFLFGSAVRTKDEKPSGASQTDVTRKSALSTSDHDHNYDSSSKNLSLEGLGVDTPSDSGFRRSAGIAQYGGAAAGDRLRAVEGESAGNVALVQGRSAAVAFHGRGFNI
ncbi:hypothetical protein J6590_039724 [Homalodisca vitripennis]|nr:hypothetical protein J6590_039724 [Homalodisca vitripennis]